MRIPAAEIGNLVFGAVETEAENGGVTYYKCTRKQREGWKTVSAALYGRSLIATGVRLDFHTDSRGFSFKALSGRKFDLLLNGRLIQTLTESDFDADGKSACVSLGGGDKRVTLVFPGHDVKTTLEYIVLDDGAAVRAHEFSRKMLFIGDSITQGWHSEFDSLSYAWQTSLHFNADSVINGVGGAVFCADTFDTSGFDPDIVVVAYGTNDFGYFKTLSELRENVHEYLTLVKNAYGDKKVFCISPIWRTDEDKNRAMGSFKECRDVIKDEIVSFGFELVDGYELVPHDKRFFADHVHPNDLGFCMYARSLIAEIEEKL